MFTFPNTNQGSGNAQRNPGPGSSKHLQHHQRDAWFDQLLQGEVHWLLDQWAPICRNLHRSILLQRRGSQGAQERTY